MKDDPTTPIGRAIYKIAQYFKLAEEEKTSAPESNGLKDAKGRLCPLAIINPVDLARERLIDDLVANAKHGNEVIAKIHEQSQADIARFIEVSNESYGAKIGKGTAEKKWKGNLQLINYNATKKINIKVADRIAFNEKINLAMEKIQALIEENSGGINDIIKVLIDEAFRVDQTGYIDAKKVLALRKHNIDNPIWQSAMQDIADSIQLVGSKSYIQFWERDTPEGEWQAISLDIARV
jgi:hypothetical protein